VQREQVRDVTVAGLGLVEVPEPLLQLPVLADLIRRQPAERAREPRAELRVLAEDLRGAQAAVEKLGSIEQQRLSVIVFRIDALESYHQLFGRHATEALLRKVAHSIGNSLQRAADYCARVGHDRFAVLIGGAEEERVVAFAERIAQRVRDLALHHPRSQLARYVTVSWSVASEIPSATAEEPGLLEDAEARVSGSVPREGPARPDDLSADVG
jgi:diguanylate cyclase (GGDEF)-like protein